MRGLHAFMALPEETDVAGAASLPVVTSGKRADGPVPDQQAPLEDKDNMSSPARSAVAHDQTPIWRMPGSPAATLLPARGQRWPYGARKQDFEARRSWRETERTRTPIERFAQVLAQLPTTGRPAIDLDLVEATLAASAANTVRGLLSMRSFGETCRRQGVSALPAQSTSVIAFLRARTSGQGGEPAKRATLSRIMWADRYVPPPLQAGRSHEGRSCTPRDEGAAPSSWHCAKAGEAPALQGRRARSGA